MNKQELNTKLKESYRQFITEANELTQDEFEYAPESKWAAGQHAEHLLKSVKAVAQGLGMPKFLIKNKFGKANRPSRDYQGVVDRYREKLSLGPVFNKTYAPGAVPFSKKVKMLNALNEQIEKLVAKTGKWSEEQLDEYIFPHPLLGKVTVREMLYFTSYHAEHHRRLIKLYLKGV